MMSTWPASWVGRGCGGRFLLALWVGGMGSAVGCSQSTEAPLEGADESFLDRAVDPCTDLYRFACGSWIKEHPVVAGFTQERTGDATQRGYILLRKLVTDAEQRVGTELAPGMFQAGDYYHSCVGSLHAPGTGHELDAQLALLAMVPTSGGLATALGQLRADGVSALFRLQVDVDPGQPSRQIMTLSPGGLTLERAAYTDTKLGLAEAYKQHIANLVGLYSTSLAIDPATVLKVESALASAAPPPEASRDPRSTYHLLSVAALQAAAPSFDWSSFWRAAGAPDSLELNVTDADFMDQLGQLLATVPVDQLLHYLRWRVVELQAATLGEKAIAEETRFHQGVVLGRKEPLPDWFTCLIDTEGALPFSLARPYVERVFDPPKKMAASSILDNIQAELGLRMQTSTWLDPATRAAALGKLAQVVHKIGYPDEWPPAPNTILARDSYGSNVLALQRLAWQSSVALLGSKVDRGKWQIAPFEANAYYGPERNEIVFTAGILQPPFFDNRRARALDYGAMGMIMGHELSHGFDDQGRQFDEVGQLRDWWSAPVEAEFARRTTCLADQYSSYAIDSQNKVNGRLTLGENIADLTGARVAYQAYRQLGAQESFREFTADQQFFLSYAQLWCADDDPRILALYGRNDVHSPPEFRVNGVVRNLPEFAEAFHCSTGAALAPAARCELW